MTSLAERMWDRIATVPESGCWIWLGPARKNGYGAIAFRGICTSAHRAMWLDAHPSEVLSTRMFVCHKCDTRLCCNPDHMFIGTAKDNAADCLAKRRTTLGKLRKTHCVRGHEFTSENTYLKSSPRNRAYIIRVCRTCHRQEQAKRARAKCRA